MRGLFERGGVLKFRNKDGVSFPKITRIQSEKAQVQEGWRLFSRGF